MSRVPARPSIHVLAPEVVNLIAAGEVVTRPSAVIRELMDNSIDAGATEIIVEIDEGGKKRILVRDNGQGMGMESMKLAVEAHATSKISTLDDLQNIRTLGFRGEALACIRGVSRMEIVSCESLDPGGHRLLSDGKRTRVTPHPCPLGTSVTVRDLFWNVPARRKFLKSESSETRAVTEVVIDRALASFGTAIGYVRDGREVFHLPASSLKERVSGLFDRELGDACITFEKRMQSLTVKGLAGDPSVTRSTRSSIYLFVNGRRVQDARLTHTVLTVYREILREGFPAVFVFIDIDPHLVDVNVHPAKAEVRFSDTASVCRHVYDAISSAVHGSRPAVVEHAAITSAQVPQAVGASSAASSQVSAGHVAGAFASSTGSSLPPDSSETPASPETPLFATTEGRFRIIGQIYRTFLLVEETAPPQSPEDGTLWIVDQHVASERVLLAKMLERIESRGAVSQPLLVPLILELGLKDSILFDRVAPALRKMGFETEPFGPRGVWVVRAVPVMLGRRVADRKLFLKFVEEMSSFDTTRRSQEEVFHDVMAHFACRAAIKAGDALMPEEQAGLLSSLLAVEHFRICPHGRPSMIQITRDELDRRFLRK